MIVRFKIKSYLNKAKENYFLSFLLSNSEVIFYCLLLILNILFFDLYNYFVIQDYNPLAWHQDNLRHHAISNNIVQYFQMNRDIYDTSILSNSYLYVWPLPNTVYAGMIYLFGHTSAYLLTIILFSILSY